jgi:hypothetical protein
VIRVVSFLVRFVSDGDVSDSPRKHLGSLTAFGQSRTRGGYSRNLW